jgi:hypothetical protein
VLSEEQNMSVASRNAVAVLVMALAVAATLSVAAGQVIAEGIGPFNGISAAQHPRGPADALDPTVARFLRRSMSGIVLDSARLVRRWPNGRRIYVATDAHHELCVVFELAMGCGPHLTRTHATTIATFRRSSGSKPESYGVALDGVTSVSFETGRGVVTVPVKDNAWAYEGQSSVLQSARIHFINGTTVVLGRHS